MFRTTPRVLLIWLQEIQEKQELVCRLEDGYWYQVGLVSFGPAPCDASIPGVYTRLAGYVNWIADTIKANGGF